MQDEEVIGTLRKLSINTDLDLARSALVKFYGSERRSIKPEEKHITALLKSVIEFATARAKREGSLEISPLHLWTGLIASGQGQVGVIMDVLKVKPR